MKTEHAPTIQRADYRPLSWTVETIDLHFHLDAEATLVTNRMLCVRNPQAENGPIRFVISAAASRNRYWVTGESGPLAPGPGGRFLTTPVRSASTIVPLTSFRASVRE